MNNRLTSRRKFLFQALPACSLCLGISRLSLGAATQEAQPLPFSKRIAEKMDITYEDYFARMYGSTISVLKYLRDQIGKERFIEMLEKGVDEQFTNLSRMNAANKRFINLATYVAGFKSDVTLQHALTYTFIKETEKEVEFSIRECLWAKTFRQSDAADLGYAMICYNDLPLVKLMNPKITLNRPKVLMQGDDECRFRYTMEA